MPRVAILLGEYPEVERRRREECVLSFATADREIGLVDLPEIPRAHGLSGLDVALVTRGFVTAAREAERLGCDAVVTAAAPPPGSAG